MALEKVVESIREEGQRQARAKVETARREAAAIVADAERQAADLKGKRSAQTASAVESLKRRELAAAELEAKKMKLNAEKEALAKVRAAVLDRLAKLPAETRVKHVQALAQSSSIANGRLLVAERDAEASKKAGLAVAGNAPVLGGVVVQSADGATREELTYEALLDEVWGASLSGVAEALIATQGRAGSRERSGAGVTDAIYGKGK